MKDFFKLVTPYFYGSEKRYARWGGLWLLVLSQASTTYGYLFIQWNRRFFDALEARNASEFYWQCGVFICIMIFYVVTFSFTRYSGQKYALRWRMWMTNSALTKWLHDADRGKLEGSDQRIQEDLMRFTLIFERFFLDCFNAILLILLFTPLLFTETKGLTLFGISQGWILFGASVIYTAIGMLISAKIANPLINLEYNNQKLEAELRYNLVHVRDGADKPQSFFSVLLDGIAFNYNQMYRRQKNFNLWQKTYDQLSYLIPFILIGGQYFSGALTLGALMQVRSTFSRIRNSMAYLLDHYTELTELLAISKRVVEFYECAQIDLTATPELAGKGKIIAAGA
ncbi:MAG TPA: SbmA/BacA-like family transporter [Gammaproteobacteria bacterium]|nr:SbmA/BacA-like family transporter [Gammaproteobacteria bacterium]